jgi:hypothetical protein
VDDFDLDAAWRAFANGEQLDCSSILAASMDSTLGSAEWAEASTSNDAAEDVLHDLWSIGHLARLAGALDIASTALTAASDVVSRNRDPSEVVVLHGVRCTSELAYVDQHRCQLWNGLLRLEHLRAGLSPIGEDPDGLPVLSRRFVDSRVSYIRRVLGYELEEEQKHASTAESEPERVQESEPQELTAPRSADVQRSSLPG